MESPVRICLSAAIVVHLLVLSNSNAHSSAIPPPTPSESQAAALDVRRTTPGYVRISSTKWIPRRTTAKLKVDSQIDDVSPKTTPEESVQTKEVKPNPVRGTVRHNTQKYKSSTPSYRRRGLSSTTTIPTTSKKPDVVVITPTSEHKNLTQIIDSMKKYSKIMTSSYSSSTEAPDIEYESDEDEPFSSDDHEDNEFDITRFTSSEFHDEDNVYSFSPSSTDDLYTHRKVLNDFSSKTPTFSHGPKSEPYKQLTSNSYDHFFSELDLTSPPRHDRFDERFKKIANSITDNIDRHIGMSTKPGSTHSGNIEGVDVTKSLKMEQFFNKKPLNNSQMIFHETKSMTVTDNEAEGSSLSDVQGTSIYFETSMLSTESYGSDINTEGDCDNDTRTEEPTSSTPPERNERLPARVTTTPTIYTTETSDLKYIGTNYPNRNSRVSPKKLNLSIVSSKEITRENAFPKKSNEISSNSVHKPTVPRRIQFTTKPPRITPRMHLKTTQRTEPSYPTTIYAEHFNIKDKSPSVTPDRRQSLLTTVSTNIDPLYETETSGTKKMVRAHTLSDNSIPGLSKRGSTKFGTIPAIENVSLEESSSEYMSIPTASSSWAALAGNIKPPPSTTFTINATSPKTKTPDENELQNVSENFVIQPSTTMSTTTTTTSNSININQLQGNQQHIDQQWTPIHSPPQSISSTSAPSYLSLDMKTDVTATPIESPPTTEPPQLSQGIPKANEMPTILSMNAIRKDDITSTLIPSKPHDLRDLKVSSNLPVNTENTTLRHVPTTTISTRVITTDVPDEEETTNTTLETVQPSTWHPVFPALNANHETTTLIEDLSITTYRPSFKASATTETISPTESQTFDGRESFPITTPNDVNENSTTTEKSEERTIINVKLTISQEPTTPKGVPTLSTESTTASVDIFTTEEIINPKPEATTAFVEVRNITTKIATQAVNEETSTSEVTTPKPEEITVFVDERKILTEIITQGANRETTTEEVTTPKPEETTIIVVEQNTTTLIVTPAAKKESTIDTKVNEMVTHASTIEISDTEITNTEKHAVDTTTLGKTFINDNTTNMSTESVTDHTSEGDVVTRIGSYSDMTTYSPNTTGPEESSSAAGVAIAVSTIGVIALLLLIGLLLVLRRRRQRGRRCGVFAQRCTPVSLDAYSLDSVSVRRKGAPRLRASKRSYGNPAYDDEVVISHPMQYAALANFALDAESMAAEFAEIPAGSVRADEVPPGCEDKNRYSNVLPLPETRVPLRRIGDDPATEYINANYVTGPGNIKNYYIACQAPLADTVADFWRMIWEQDSRLIVMLTEYMENGVEKSYEYLPPSEVTDNKRIFGGFQVVLKRREHRDKYAVSSVQLTETATRRWREVTQLWYFWPAKGVPEDHDSVINFVAEMRSHMKMAQSAKEFDEDGADTSLEAGARPEAAVVGPDGVRVYSPQRAEELMRSNGANGTLGRMKAAAESGGGVRPCVVTCASGAGRTGALLALDVCARALEGAGAVDVPRTVRALRSARPHSVQNKSQYMFIYKVLSEYGNKLTGGGVDSI